MASPASSTSGSPNWLRKLAMIHHLGMLADSLQTLSTDRARSRAEAEQELQQNQALFGGCMDAKPGDAKPALGEVEDVNILVDSPQEIHYHTTTPAAPSPAPSVAVPVAARPQPNPVAGRWNWWGTAMIAAGLFSGLSVAGLIIGMALRSEPSPAHVAPKLETTQPTAKPEAARPRSYILERVP